MGFNRRKIEAEQKAKADAEAADRRAADAQVSVDAEGLVAAWNECQARRMPLLFAPTIGAALASAPGGAKAKTTWLMPYFCRTLSPQRHFQGISY